MDCNSIIAKMSSISKFNYKCIPSYNPSMSGTNMKVRPRVLSGGGEWGTPVFKKLVFSCLPPSQPGMQELLLWAPLHKEAEAQRGYLTQPETHS